MSKPIDFFCLFLFFLPPLLGLKIDETFLIQQEALYDTNWIELGSSQYLDNFVRLIPDVPDRISLIKPNNKILYQESFTLDLVVNISKNNVNLAYGEGMALWLLREDLGYTQINYTQNNALLYGSSGIYKGLGIFVLPNPSNLSDSKLVGKENTKMFVFQKDSIMKNARSCEIDLSNSSVLQEIRINYEDFLFVYVKNQKTQRFELCFNLAENYEIMNKEFIFMISAQSTKAGGQVIDLYSLILSSDVVNVEYQQENPENTKPENESEFENLQYLQEKIKSILLVQIEQMQKLQHIKHYNSLSLKDMKNDIKDVAFFQKLVAFEVDIQVMSEVLHLQNEKINDILQTFASFGNQTQETITDNEQMKKKETERITYFENYLSEFEKSFGIMEVNLRKFIQERENSLSKINSMMKSQRTIQENKDILLNSLSNYVEVMKFLIENEQNDLNWTNYVTLINLLGILVLIVLLIKKFMRLDKEHLR